MEFFATTWWIWLIVAASTDFILVITVFFQFRENRFTLGMVLFWMIAAISIIPWILFVIGAIAALIGYAKG